MVTVEVANGIKTRAAEARVGLIAVAAEEALPAHDAPGSVNDVPAWRRGPRLTLGHGASNDIARGFAEAVGLEVYPNPFSNQTNVYYTIEDMDNVSVRLYSITGQEVYSNDFGMQTSGKHNFQINGENISAGLYVMNLVIGNKTISYKLSVTK